MHSPQRFSVGSTFLEENNTKLHAVTSHFEKYGNLRLQIRFEPKIGLQKSDFEQYYKPKNSQVLFGKNRSENTEYLHNVCKYAQK